jgi:acyl-coenzyme A synthetase/AMP-(fatty) acid ligase
MSSAALLPLTCHAEQEVIARYGGRSVTTAEFLAQAATLAAALPTAGQAVNLCEDRYLFLLAFAALLMRGQANLLPPNRAPRVVEEVAAAYPGSYCLVDRPHTDLALPQHVVTVPAGQGEATPIRAVPEDRLAAVIFTSGSTGAPRPHRKYWGDLVRGMVHARARFALHSLECATLLATVPPQHMYGLEFTILFPLLNGLALHGGRPFYPEDLRRALAEVPAPRLLVTTPVHLRACVAAGLAWPPLAMILCATAPLGAALAAEAEAAFGCPVQEIYGCTETGAIATRRTAAEARWRPYDSVRLHCDDGHCQAEADFLRGAVPLNDVIELQEDGFILRGRDSDMINIAGKRASLGDLTHRLLDIPGVEDAALIVQDEARDRGGRLCAVVVAPQLSEQAILDALRPRLDAVFMPRPLYRVERLPRNETGKLPRAALLALLGQLRRGDGIQ